MQRDPGASPDVFEHETVTAVRGETVRGETIDKEVPRLYPDWRQEGP